MRSNIISGNHIPDLLVQISTEHTENGNPVENLTPVSISTIKTHRRRRRRRSNKKKQTKTKIHLQTRNKTEQTAARLPAKNKRANGRDQTARLINKSGSRKGIISNATGVKSSPAKPPTNVLCRNRCQYWRRSGRGLFLSVIPHQRAAGFPLTCLDRPSES